MKESDLAKGKKQVFKKEIETRGMKGLLEIREQSGLEELKENRCDEGWRARGELCKETLAM